MRHALGLGLVALTVLCWRSAPAQTADALEAWRARITEVRTLAENDVPAAYAEAVKLEANVPASALPADRARALNLLARTELYYAQTEQSSKHASQAYELALRNGDKIGQAESDLNTALNSVNEARIDKLVESTTRGLAVLEGTPRNDLLGEALLRVAVMYRRVGQIEESVSMAMQAMEIARRSNDALALTYAHQGLAISFDQSFRYQDALEHFTGMRDQARRAKSMQLEAYAIAGMAGSTGMLGDITAAERLMREAIDIFKRTGAPFAIAYGKSQLATNLRLQGRYAEARAALDEVLATYERYPNRIGMWFTLNSRSVIGELLKQRAEAKADAQRAYALAKDIAFPLYVSESARRMAALAAADGDYRLAYTYGVEADEATAKATRERASERMVQLAQRYESQSHQRQISELTQRNLQQQADLRQAELRQRLLWTVLGAALLLFAGGAYFMLRLRWSQTELRRSATVLRVREQEFRALVEHSPDVIARYDEQCRRIYVNPALVNLYGSGVEELLGKTPSEVSATTVRETADYVALLRTVMSTGKSATLDLSVGDSYIQFRLVPEQDVDGSVSSVLAIGRDVTAMVATQRRLTTLLENLPDMVARFDASGRYVYVNPAVTRVFGMAPEAFIGKTVVETGLDPQAQLQSALESVIRDNAPNVMEVPWLGPDGARYFEVRHLPEHDESGRVTTVLGIAREVTERRRVEQLVREIGFRREAAREEERKYIARELHDELGQLLSALRFEVSVIRMRFGPSDPGIAERAASMLSLVDSIIRLQRDLVSSLRPAVLDMGIGAALEWLVAEFGERSGIECTLDLSEAQVDLDADQTTAVFRIVQESLTNVTRHAHAKNVQVSVTRDDAVFTVSVADDGRGFNAQATRDRKSMGLVGLNERAQMLGGQLEVRSAKGRGTTIVVTFPAVSSRVRPALAGSESGLPETRFIQT